MKAQKNRRGVVETGPAGRGSPERMSLIKGEGSVARASRPEKGL